MKNLEDVLNLVINGLPSIQRQRPKLWRLWGSWVLNLVINGLPSIRDSTKKYPEPITVVLNLVINGLPSILYDKNGVIEDTTTF